MPVFCQRGFACGETARAVIGPAFWVCRAKSGAAFRCAKPPCAVVRFAAMTSSPRTDVLACPAFALLSHSPTALLNTPALVAIRLHFAARNRAGRSLPPPGATCSLPHFRFAQMWPRIFPRGLPGYVPLFPGWPRARTPALASVRSHFAPRNRAAGHRPHRGRCFGLPRFRFAQARSPGQNPGACSHSVAFRLRRNRAAGRCPRWGQRARYPIFAPLKCGPALAPRPSSFSIRFFLRKNRRARPPPLSDGGALTKSENIILCASSCHPPRSPYPHCTLPRVRFSGIGQKKKPQRKTAAAVNTLYMSCKKTNVNPISFPIAFFLLKRFRSQMTIRLHGETNMYS